MNRMGAVGMRLQRIRQNAQLIELSLIVFLWQASVGVFFLSLVQQYLPEELHAGAAFPGYAMALYGAARFLWQAPSGWLADRLGRRLMMVAGGACTLPILVAMMEVHDERLFLAFSGLLGVAGATSWPALLAHIGDTSDRAQRGRVMNLLNVSQLVGLGVGTMVGVTLFDFISYGAAFAASLSFNALALVFVARRADVSGSRVRAVSPATQPGVERSRACSVTWQPGVLLLGAIVLFLSLGTTVHSPIIGQYVREVLDTEFHRLALLLIAPGAVAAVILLRIGHWADRFGRQVPLIAGLAVAAASIFALTLTRNPYIAVNLVVLAGLAYAVSLPAWGAAALDATDLGSRGAILGALTAVQGLGGAMGQAMGGQMGELWGPLAPFKFGSLFILIALLLTLAHLRQQAVRRRWTEALPAAVAPVSLPVE